MDQIKAHLAGVLAYGFWIGCVLVLLGSLGVWWMSTSTLDSENSSRVSKIKGEVNKVKQLQGELSDQPNEASHKEMQRMIDRRKQQVVAAWRRIYEAQSKILTWPDTLKAAYTDEFKFVKEPGSDKPDKSLVRLPFELHTEFPPEPHQDAPLYIRQGYRYYIDQELPQIATIAKAEWTAKFDAQARLEGSGAYLANKRREDSIKITGVEQGPVVAWSSDSQESVLADLFPWRGRVPSTLEVYYSQENIWILKQLLEIIANVNGDARQPFEAKIREIALLSIGKSVRFGAGAIAAPNTGMGAGNSLDYEMGDMSMDMDVMEDMGGDSIDLETIDPGDNRYLNIEGAHITGADLRGALSSNSPQDAPLAVAKRVPVKMVVKMDQRFVPQLLAACGSAPLMVEVKQTRILPKDTSIKTAASGAGEEGAGMDMDMESEGGESGMESAGSALGGFGPKKPKDEFPLDMVVEVYGLIYLYNPPNEEALGIEKVTEETVDAMESGEPVQPQDDLPAPAAGDTTTDPAATEPATPTPAAGPTAIAAPVGSP